MSWAQRLAIHQSTASNLIDALEKRGLISKEREQGDQRVVKVKLSDAGHTLLTSAPLHARGLLQQALIQLDDESLEQLNVGLQSLLEGIDLLAKLLS